MRLALAEVRTPRPPAPTRRSRDACARATLHTREQACGIHCVVLDAGSAREDGVSRAVWQGLEFVRYLLGSRWLGAPTAQAAQAAQAAPPSHAAAANAPQFARHVAKLSDLAKRKVDYYKKFLPADPTTAQVHLSAVACPSLHDSDDAHYRALARRLVGGHAEQGAAAACASVDVKGGAAAGSTFY